MGAAVSILVLLSISVLFIRIASVALRATGLADTSARFQALSAFTGTGFTTSEAETVVNYPIRRKIVSTLMVLGNLGLVSVFATLAASFVHTDAEVSAVLRQLAWLLGGLGILWFLMLNKTADRILCVLIERLLSQVTFLGKRNFHRLLQVGNGYSICEHTIKSEMLDNDGKISNAFFDRLELTPLSVHTAAGEHHVYAEFGDSLVVGDAIVAYGADHSHELFAEKE